MATESKLTKDVVHENRFNFHNKQGEKAPFVIIWWGYDMTSRGTVRDQEGEGGSETLHGFGVVSCTCKSGGCGGINVYNEGPNIEPYANCSKCGFSVKMLDPTTLLINGVRYYGTPVGEKIIQKSAQVMSYAMEEENRQFNEIVDSYLKFLDKLSCDLRGILVRVDDELHSIKLRMNKVKEGNDE